MTENKCLESVSVAEDTVHCYFFSSIGTTNLMYWEKLQESMNNIIKELSAIYIWHRDEFKVLMPIPGSDKSDFPPHLFSATCFGENIEDEWFIVYLLLEITKLHKEVIIQVRDNDGDFLLIEAADHLPAWANPDTTENRVFLYQNNIHIIPPSSDLCKDRILHLNDSIRIISKLNFQTKATNVHKAILKRIGNYPEKIKENMHRGKIQLPIDIATLLSLKPSLISPLVSVYCNHDSVDVKSCQDVKFDNLITVGVEFTKCLYAMLIHAKLIKTAKHKHFNGSDIEIALGFKLTCGFEIIMKKMSGDIFSTKEYTKYIKSLEKNGYFKENIEGSKSYQQLLKKAREFFMSLECPINFSVCNNVTEIMSSKEFTEMKNKLKDGNVSETEIIVDNDDWLSIHPQQLNDLLNERYGNQSKFKCDDSITPQTLTSELSGFLAKTSNFEGIELKDENFEDSHIEFDAGEFVNSLKNMLNIVTCGDGNIDSLSDISENYEENYDDITLEDELDEELKEKLKTEGSDYKSSEFVLRNIVQSIKEEKGSTGPSSHLLKTIGINKTDILDFDSDDE